MATGEAVERLKRAAGLRVWLGAVLVAGCSGNIKEADEIDGPLPGYEEDEVVPLPLALRRLTNAEYDASVALLLGTTPDASTRYAFRRDPLDAEGYDNRIDTLSLSEARASEYAAAARRHSLAKSCSRTSGGRP